MDKIESRLKEYLEADFGVLLFPVLMLISCTLSLMFLMYGFTHSMNHWFILFGVLWNFATLAATTMGMLHYRTLGYLDGLRERK